MRVSSILSKVRVEFCAHFVQFLISNRVSQIQTHIWFTRFQTRKKMKLKHVIFWFMYFKHTIYEKSDHGLHGRNGIWDYYFWLKNDGKKLPRKNIFQIPPCGSHFLLIHFTSQPFLQNRKFIKFPVFREARKILRLEGFQKKIFGVRTYI